MKKSLLIFFLFSGMVAKCLAQGQWNEVLQSSITFKIVNAELVANGRFDKLSTKISYNPANPSQTKFHASIDVESIKTGISLRDKHLKRPSYFFILMFPTIEVELQKILKVEDPKRLVGVFLIKMKGIEKTQTIAFSVKEEAQSSVFDANFSVNRREFEVGAKSWTLSRRGESVCTLCCAPYGNSLKAHILPQHLPPQPQGPIAHIHAARQEH